MKEGKAYQNLKPKLRSPKAKKGANARTLSKMKVRLKVNPFTKKSK